MTEQAWRFTQQLCVGVPLSTALDGLPESFAATPVGEKPRPVAADVLAQHLSAGRFIDAQRQVLDLPDRHPAIYVPGTSRA